MTQRAFDNDGNEVFPVTLNAICPLEFAAQARESVLQYLKDVELAGVGLVVDLTVDKMLNVSLGPIGSPEITHVFCSRVAHTNQVASSLSYIRELSLPWCGDREFTTEDDPDEIKARYCVVTGDKAAVLAHLQLEVK